MQDDGSAEALGGAIYNTSTLNLGDVIFSNNKHQDEALNDIYTTANSVINVTGRAEIGSGLQSADNSAQINIQNGGNLVLVGKQTLADGTETVGNNAGYTGALNVAQGGILTLKGTDEADTLAAILANADTTNWADGSGLAFDIKNDIAARPGQDNPPVAPDDTISASDISNIISSNAQNVDIYKYGDNYITFSDDYSAIGRNVYIKDGTMRFFVENNDTEGGGEKYFNGGNANTYISDGAKFIFEISGEENNTTFAGNLISETVADEIKAEFQKAGDAALTLTGDNSGFNGDAVVEWGELVIDGRKSFFGENANIVVDCQRNFSGNTGEASLTYNNITGGVFNQNITLKSEGILSINGVGRGEENAVTINNTISTEGADNVVNLSDADFTLNTNLGSGQILNLSNAGITLGEGVTSLEHAITMESGSALNLADNAANTYTFGNITSTGTNNINLDVDLSSGSDGQTDILNAGAASSGLLTIDDVNILGNNGAVTNKTYTVINNNGGNLGFAEYNGQKSSDVYIYDITASGSELSIVATAIAANGLKYQNHFVSGTRPFVFVGDSVYTIEEDLETTLAGNFTVSGKSDAASDSVFSGGDAHSFFEVGADTKLTLENLTIQNALASKDDYGAGTKGASANENGAVVNATGGTVNLENVVLQDNHADGNGGAISAAGDAIVSVTNSQLRNNFAKGAGGVIYAKDDAQVTISNSMIEHMPYSMDDEKYTSIIYNDGAEVTLNDVNIMSHMQSSSENSLPAIYNSGTLTINATKSDSQIEIMSVNAIQNSGILNLNAAADKNIHITTFITGSNVKDSIINVNSDPNNTGFVNIDNAINSTVKFDYGTAKLYTAESSIVNVNNDVELTAGSGIFPVVFEHYKDVTLNINDNAVVKYQGGNIVDGQINIDKDAELIAGYTEMSGADFTISSDISGEGTISKIGSNQLTLTGNDNGADFTGVINVNAGTLVFNQVYGLNAGATVNIADAIVNYTTGDGTLSNETLANINLNGNAQFNVDADNHKVTIANKFWTTAAGKSNNLNFNDGTYNLGFNTSGLTDVLNFTDSNITLSQADNGSITMNNSTLDLSNQQEGNNYNFVSLNAAQGTNNISLDLNLYVDDKQDPIADTINATAGEGTLNLTKVFITNDNGQIFRYTGKNIIPVISGGNNLQLAVNDGTELLSWATNVYKYEIDSALAGKGIEITYGGPSSTDTLRDLNIYQGEDIQHNNRGFNFIVDASGNNSYNIYRDLDTTAAGNFTIIGTVNNGTKSVLSGELKDLVLDADTAKTRLEYNQDDNSYTYKNADGSDDRTFEATNVTDGVDEAGNPVKIIKVAAMADGDKNGSFFELTNATNLEISNVTIKDAYRGAGESDTNGYTKYGSVIYAMNQDATVNLTNVDFVGNKSAANGGAIGNVLSKEFNITGGSFDDNHSNALGGAIYTAINMNIKDTDFGKTTLNTHSNGVANDIYIANNTVTFEVSDKNIINSGLATRADGSGTFNKTGAGTLLLNGNNEDMLGTLKVSAGELKYTADGSEDSFVGGSVNIAEYAKLTMDINSNTDIQQQIIKNVSGSGELSKVGLGSLNMEGDNSNFDGQLSIDEGVLAFTNDSNTYIAGTTDIADGASLNYTTVSAGELSNVTGSGILNKNGGADLTFNYTVDGNKFSGTANANAGTLTVNAASDAAQNFDFNMVANGGDIVYNAIAGQTYTLDSNSKISFSGDNNTITFNNGIYNLNGSINGLNNTNTIAFSGSVDTPAQLILGQNKYDTGIYSIVDNTIIDLQKSDNNTFNTYEFSNLNIANGAKAELKVDLEFNSTADRTSQNSDMLVSNGKGGVISVTDLNLSKVYDCGLHNPIEFTILGGNLTLDKEVTPTSWATDVYNYNVSVGDSGQSIILEAISAANENSLRAQNIHNGQEGTRGFSFQSQQNDLYVIGNHLGETAGGTFTVSGKNDGNNNIISHISGDKDNDGAGEYSMFDLQNKTDLRLNDLEISHAATDKNGSVINHENSGAISNISNAYIHHNTSGGKGGAIYANGQVNLTDVKFENNTHADGANDIYIDGENAKVNYIAASDGKNVISSGIAGSGILNKTGESELKLSGSNENFTGNLLVSAGTLNFDQNSADDTYIKGTTTIANAADVKINADMSEITTGAFAGGANSAITKDGDFDMTLTGDNSQFKGTANINAGNVIYNTDDTTFFGGKTNLAADTGIVI